MKDNTQILLIPKVKIEHLKNHFFEKCWIKTRNGPNQEGVNQSLLNLNLREEDAISKFEEKKVNKNWKRRW